jgi:hypothetical protein
MLDRTETIADIFVLIPNLLTNSVSIVSSCSHFNMMSLHCLRKTIDPSQVVQTNQRPSRRDERAYRALLLAHYTQRSTCRASSICDDCVNLFNICFIIIPRSPKKTASSPASTVCRGHHTTLTSRPCRLAYGRRRVPKTGLLTASHHPSHTTPMILLQHTQRDWLKSSKKS